MDTIQFPGYSARSNRVEAGFGGHTRPPSIVTGTRDRRELFVSSWECVLCGYVYDPDEGDPTQGIEPGTDFEDLPDDWECPECGAGKEDFEKL